MHALAVVIPDKVMHWLAAQSIIMDPRSLYNHPNSTNWHFSIHMHAIVLNSIIALIAIIAPPAL